MYKMSEVYLDINVALVFLLQILRETFFTVPEKLIELKRGS